MCACGYLLFHQLRIWSISFFNKLSYSNNVSTYLWVKVHWSAATRIPDYLQRRFTAGRTRLNPALQNPEPERIRELKQCFWFQLTLPPHQDLNSLTGGTREQQGSHSNAISYLTELLISCSDLPDRVCNHEAICGNLDLELKPPPKKCFISEAGKLSMDACSVYYMLCVTIPTQFACLNMHKFTKVKLGPFSNVRCLSAQYTFF